MRNAEIGMQNAECEINKNRDENKLFVPVFTFYQILKRASAGMYMPSSSVMPYTA